MTDVKKIIGYDRKRRKAKRQGRKEKGKRGYRNKLRIVKLTHDFECYFPFYSRVETKLVKQRESKVKEKMKKRLGMNTFARQIYHKKIHI